MSKPKVGIRTTAGPLIGTGHLRRCVTLAKWLDRDVEVELMVAPDTSGPASAQAMQRWFAEQGIKGALVPPSFDGLGTASHYRGHVALVIDDYGLTDEFCTNTSSVGQRLS
jgi:spore coat polysaccharide biosynthesis predicted glycosyltransferase SpsG